MLRALAATIRNALRSPNTVRYPTERPKMPARYRGRHIFYDQLCIGCSLCAKVCPNNTIIMLERPEQTDPKLKHRPIIDLNRCIFCGYCAEVCPAKCLFMGNAYEMAGKDKAELLFTYRGMIASGAAPDNERAIFPKLEAQIKEQFANETRSGAANQPAEPQIPRSEGGQ